MTITHASATSSLRSLLSAMRPPQWVKNCLIVVAPAAAGILTHPTVISQTALAFIAFCSVSSAIYLLNDVQDLDADRHHPTKRFRAIASGRLSTTTAIGSALVLLTVGFLVAATHIPFSTWFLVVISFGALFLVVGKRASELKSGGDISTRRVLAEYSAKFLDSALTMCATIVVAGYCLWAFNASSTGLSANHDAVLPGRLSVVPVVFAVLFIMRSAEAGDGAAPEELLLHNRTVQVLLAVWVVLMIFSVYE